jgi:hypothetical protein
VIPPLPRTFPVGFKWVFVQKRNEINEVVRYKVRLIAQGLTKRPDVDFNETYSLRTSMIIRTLEKSKKVLGKFIIDKAYPLRTPMIVRFLEKDIDPFRLKQEGEDVL